VGVHRNRVGLAEPLEVGGGFFGQESKGTVGPVGVEPQVRNASGVISSGTFRCLRSVVLIGEG
jgi:hypothetical protein